LIPIYFKIHKLVPIDILLVFLLNLTKYHCYFGNLAELSQNMHIFSNKHYFNKFNEKTNGFTLAISIRTSLNFFKVHEDKVILGISIYGKIYLTLKYN
jgi:hypothetical protein